jgi:geranylgeranyl reductase family protein
VTDPDPTEQWDLVVVGAGPAGACAALGALRADPGLSVLLLDRAAFPRDKVCGDGIAPHALDLLSAAGVTDIVTDRYPVRRLRLRRRNLEASALMQREAWVVPRTVFDARLVDAARDAGAVVRQQHVREVVEEQDQVRVDALRARVVVGADGAHSLVRSVAGVPRPRMALAIRGYAPPSPERLGEQVIVFGTGRRPSYAWSFDRGDGLANVGYGELLSGEAKPNRAELLRQLGDLLPGATVAGTGWRGHHLPLSSWSWPHPDGRILLAGDAAGLVNPLTGEGIYYAVATGLLAGTVAATAADHGERPGRAYGREVRRLLARHLRHTALAAKLCARGRVLDAGIHSAGTDQQVFDDLVEIGLGRGLITPAIARGLLGSMAR